MTSLPDEFEADYYVMAWPDLADLPPSAASRHYEQHGRAEGRRANRLENRQDFIDLVPRDVSSLEIGPFYAPALVGPGVSYFDVLSQDELRTRAASLDVDKAAIPFIDFVSPTGDLAAVHETFGAVLSSHCIEHQPDLVYHLNQVARILQPGGRYFLLVPDKRYCFDTLMAESTVADVLGAHHQRRRVHPLKSVIEHRAMTTHNDTVRHWSGDHGTLPPDHPRRVLEAIDEFRRADGGYIDVHAWYFTPDSLARLVDTLHDIGLTVFTVERTYPTRVQANEFWMVLRKD